LPVRLCAAVSGRALLRQNVTCDALGYNRLGDIELEDICRFHFDRGALDLDRRDIVVVDNLDLKSRSRRC
jgi:hypothetical protein